MVQSPAQAGRSLRAFIFDLDGTLLDSRKQVPPANREAILGLRRRPGALVAFATARPPRATYPLLDGLADTGHLICYNGAVVFHDRKRVSDALIPASLVHELLERMAGHFPELACGLEHDNELYCVGNFDRHFPCDYQANLQRSQLPIRPTPKILIDVPTPAHVAPLRALLPQDCESVLTDKGGLLQVMFRGVSKRSAVAALLHAHGIRWDETVCFGDDLNDLELIRACGTSVAMGNAHPEVLQAATHSTLSNDEAGVAAALHSLGLS